MSSQERGANIDKEDEIALPGFRFHPTDEELVGFYLRRKVDKKPIRIELIKQIDIYKHDPWDLPKSSSAGEEECYFFCKRGRKYRNSIRPNRVTGSGFWKATGIDKPVYSSSSLAGGSDRDGGRPHCIGLKKTLVYYRGSAGKGSKTDWMMHEFRLPLNDDHHNHTNSAIAKTSTAQTQEAEVWTLCRIFKRNVTYRKYTPNWREISNKRHHPTDHHQSSSRPCSTMESNNQENYINFGTPAIDHIDKKPVNHVINKRNNNYQLQMEELSSIVEPASMASSSSFSNPDGNDFLSYYENWDELRSVVEFALDP